MVEQKKKLDYVYIVLIILMGILFNYIGNWIVNVCSFPLYLDSIGTIFAAALAGIFPGIIVGYSSNVINGLSDANTLYYGLINILIALVAGAASRRGYFQRYKRIFAILLVLVVICGGVGSIMSWFIYGMNFGEKVSSTFMKLFYGMMGLPKTFSEFMASMTMELMDKFLSLTLVFVLLRYLPDKFKNKYELGELYLKNSENIDIFSKHNRRIQHSLKKEVVIIISSASIAISTISGAICFALYQDSMIDNYKKNAMGVAELLVKNVPANKVARYLEIGEKDRDYEETQKSMERIKNAFSDVKYLHVYQIHDEGGQVIFDLDTQEVKAGELGDILTVDKPHIADLQDLYNGEVKDYVTSNGDDGWLFTVYQPVFDSNKNCVAYACVDMDMQIVVNNRVAYIAKMISVLFSSLIIISIVAIWFAKRRIVQPINTLTAVAAEYAYKPDEQKVQDVHNEMKLDIHTGNEIEELYYALTKTMQDVTQYINNIHEQAEVISKMQYNIITVFADMVENRDENTGEHIHRTAAFVGIIAKELKKEGKFTDILTDQYIEDLEISAPLHDIGKIKIPDSILNKPGRLTSEEFEKMKSHAGEGRKILQKAIENLGEFSYLMISMDMSGYHHERWDGTGYPEQLKGEEIPLCARIMAVADVFDALISKRSYKDAFSFEEAVNIIQEEKGTHFDPVVVEAFINALSEVKMVVEELSNQ